MRRFIALLIMSMSVCQMHSQSEDTIQVNSNAVRVYLNCGYCYQDYLKTEITWVDFVRDQFVANINLLITSLPTGSGGQDFNLIFIGLEDFAGMKDTLHYTSSAIQTDVEIRDGLAQSVKLGLIRYVAKTSDWSKVAIQSSELADSLQKGVGENPGDDPWNAWVFNVSGNMYGGGQKVSTSFDFYGGLNANRTTAKNKFMIRFNPNYSEDRFEFDNKKSKFVQRNLNSAVFYVKAINEHWSVGGFGSYAQSIFRNLDFSVDAQAAVEYNVYPYKEAQTKAMTFAYYIGGGFLDYTDTTVYNKTKESVIKHNLTYTLIYNKEWGSISGSLYGGQYINLKERYNLGAYLSLDVRIFKGLSVNAYVNYEVLRNQINLRKAGVSEADVYLQQRELSTNYSFWTSVGINYRFGSIYNNVVNPRFSNG